MRRRLNDSLQNLFTRASLTNSYERNLTIPVKKTRDHQLEKKGRTFNRLAMTGYKIAKKIKKLFNSK